MNKSFKCSLLLGIMVLAATPEAFAMNKLSGIVGHAKSAWSWVSELSTNHKRVGVAIASLIASGYYRQAIYNNAGKFGAAIAGLGIGYLVVSKLNLDTNNKKALKLMAANENLVSKYMKKGRVEAGSENNAAEVRKQFNFSSWRLNEFPDAMSINADHDKFFRTLNLDLIHRNAFIFNKNGEVAKDLDKLIIVPAAPGAEEGERKEMSVIASVLGRESHQLNNQAKKLISATYECVVRNLDKEIENIKAEMEKLPSWDAAKEEFVVTGIYKKAFVSAICKRYTIKQPEHFEGIDNIYKLHTAEHNMNAIEELYYNELGKQLPVTEEDLRDFTYNENNALRNSYMITYFKLVNLYARLAGMSKIIREYIIKQANPREGSDVYGKFFAGLRKTDAAQVTNNLLAQVS